MKILQVNKFVYRKGGADRHMLDLADLLTEAGHEVSVFGMRHPENPAWPDDDLFVSYVDFEQPRTFGERVRALGRMLYSFEAKQKFGALLDRRKPDVVHIHNVYHQLSPSILVEAKKRNIPVVMTLHDFKLLAPNYLLAHDGAVCETTKPDRFFRAVGHRCVKGSRLGSFACALETWLHRRFGLYAKTVDLFISPSRFLANKLCEYVVPAKRVEVLPNFLSRRPLPPNADNGSALFLGRLSDEKGVSVLLDAWQRLPDIPLKIAGTGPVEARLRKLTQTNALTNIEFVGYKTGAELDALIAGARLVVVPSIWYENQPLTILEAFQFGKPIVASDIGAIPELVVDGVNGRLVPPRDQEALAKTIRSLWEDPEARQRMGEANRNKAAAFAPERYLERITGLYEKLVRTKSQG